MCRYAQRSCPLCDDAVEESDEIRDLINNLTNRTASDSEIELLVREEEFEHLIMIGALTHRFVCRVSSMRLHVAVLNCSVVRQEVSSSFNHGNCMLCLATTSSRSHSTITSSPDLPRILSCSHGLGTK